MKNLAETLKRITETTLSKLITMRVNQIYNKERLGSEYGGWEIVIDKIGSDSVIYSFGVGNDASFDIDMIDKYNCSIHAFDPTPKSIEWVKAQSFSDKFIMHEHGIAGFDGHSLFYPPDDPNHISHTILDRKSTASAAISVPVKRLNTIMKELGHDRIDILKMDIEGAEYDVIDDISSLGIRPQQILIEFHHRFPGLDIRKTIKSVGKLRGMGYLLFIASSTCKELCFIHKPP